MNVRLSILLTIICLMISTGCALSPPERTYVEQQPKTAPVRNITSFTPALQCMDQMFLAHNKNNYMITSSGIPDATGQMQAGTKEMLISTIAKMSSKSNALTFVDFDLDKRDVLAAQQLIGIPAGFEVPRYYIRGAVTQVDKGIIADRMGGGIGFSLGGGGSGTKKGKLGYSSDINTSVITVDLNMGDLVTRQIIPGVSTSNSIVVTRRGEGFDADAEIQKFGVAFELSMDRSEGSHQALRTLIELTLIEVLGKFAGLPYWECLQIKQTDPRTMVAAHKQYEQIKPGKDSSDSGLLLQKIVAGLTAGGYLHGSAGIQSADDPHLRQAIAKYQAENDLVANGRLDFDLYYDMRNKGLIKPEGGGTTISTGGVTPSQPATVATQRGGGISVHLMTSRGTTPVYDVGEKLDLTAQISSDGYLYCYYSDENGKIARVFPNRYAPNAFVNAGQSIGIPGQADFSIVFTEAGQRQEMVCLASKQEVGVQLPASLKVPDLEPIGVSSMEDVIQAFRTLDRDSLVHQRMRLAVVRR